MNKNVSFLFAISIAALLAGCVMTGISGSGAVITETRNVSGFSGISVSGSGELIVEQTGVESLTITADDNLLPYIRSDVTGGMLRLGPRDGMTRVIPSSRLVYRVTVKELNRLDVSGSGSVEASGLRTNELEMGISGSGRIAADGDAENLRISISGSGGFRGENLRGSRVKIDISGSGRAVVAARDTLDASVSGSGSVEYVGQPRVNQHVSGSGSVRSR